MEYDELTPVVYDRWEIRMGGQNSCKLKFEGKWIPKLPDYTWQDIYAQSTDGRYLGLVAWDISKGNNPGFKIVIIDKKQKTVVETDRIPGCCTSLKWDMGGFKPDIFLYIGERDFQHFKPVSSEQKKGKKCKR